jgi:Nuclear transport factor 2 (NTF2) domain
MTTRIPEATLIRIVQSYYDAVDSRDSDRIGSLYLPAPSTTLQFNADPPIVTIEAIKAFSAQFTQAVAGIKHSMIEIWTNPLKGDVVPVDLPPPRSSSTVTVVSTALPTFSIRNASGVTSSLALPAASIFTIDKQAEKFVSVHNMFDIAKVYAAVQCST